MNCEHCDKVFRPKKKTSKWCSKQCQNEAYDISRSITRDASGAIVSQSCLQCEIVKPASDFHAKSLKSGTIQGSCKPCALQRVKKWQKDNPERYEENWKRSTHGRDRLRRKAVEYNISVEDLQRLYDNADGKCEICGNGPKRWLVIDHCHNSTKVRGIICEQCNQALGLFKDNPEVMRAAALYIERDPVVYSEYERAPRRRLNN